MRLYTLMLVGDCYIGEIRQATSPEGLGPMPEAVGDLGHFGTVRLGPRPEDNVFGVGREGEQNWFLQIAEIPGPRS